jgi:hypothetical protein
MNRLIELSKIFTGDNVLIVCSEADINLLFEEFKFAPGTTGIYHNTEKGPVADIGIRSICYMGRNIHLLEDHKLTAFCTAISKLQND